MLARSRDKKAPRGSGKAVLAGCSLGVAVLLWLLLTSFAPGFGFMIAIFGSPVIAWVIILRLLTLPPTGQPQLDRHPHQNSGESTPPSLSRQEPR
jgi:hypothetical protein